LELFWRFLGGIGVLPAGVSPGAVWGG
jgi:hypothetical protein